MKFIKIESGSHSYRIGIYVRESRDDNEENYETIETQRDLLISYVKNNKLGSIEKIYIDDNVSGSVFERKGIESLKADVIDGKINLLLLKDLSRLGRNNAKTLLFLDFLEEKAVRVITFDGRYDSIKDNDTVGIDTWYNERYIRDISRKIRTNLRYKIQKGEYIGHAPFGYEKSPHEKNKLIIKNDEATVVKKIYKLYREGYGYSYIADRLNALKISSPSKGQWNPVGVRRVLCSRVYVGDTVQGVSEKVSFKSKKTRRLPKDVWVITEETHEAIIDRQEFEEVQKIRENKNMHLGTHKGIIHLFRGLLFCGRCKSPMFARKRKERPTGYICSNYARNGKSYCASHHVNERLVKDIVICDLNNLLNESKNEEKILRILKKSMRAQDNTAALDRLGKQLEAKLRQQEVLYQDRLDGKISENLFTRMNQQFENRIYSLNKELDGIKSSDIKHQDNDEILKQIKRSIKEGYLTNEMIRIIISRIVVFDPMDNYQEETWRLGLDAEEVENVNNYGGLVIEYNY